MPFLPGQKTLAYLRYQARSRADRLIQGAPIVPTAVDPYAGQNVTTPELNGMINGSLGEESDELITQYDNYWKVEKFTFTTTGTADTYPLPLDFAKHILTEWQQAPGTDTMNWTLPRMNYKEQNEYNKAVFLANAPFGIGNAAYQIVDNNIQLRPTPMGGLTMRIHYVPIPPVLFDRGTITCNTTISGDVLNFEVDATGQFFPNAAFTAVAHGQPQTSTHFVIGGTGSDLGDAGTATSLAAVLNANFGGVGGTLTATASGVNVIICLVQPASITWSLQAAVLANSIVLDPLFGTGSTGLVFKWSNVMQAYSGLDEYVIVDAAIKILQKQDRDTSVLMAQKGSQLSRIKTKYANRDPGAPRTMTDVSRNSMGPWGNLGYRGGY